MKEQIEIDRETLRDNAVQEGKFSYIPHLFNFQRKKPGNNLDIRSLSTLEAILKIEEQFTSSNFRSIRKLDKIKSILILRENLFESVMQFLHLKKVKDDLFYWIPGCKIDNIFSFILEILPDFPARYKSYYIQNVITRNTQYYNCLSFIKERHKNEYEQFEMMQMDAELFENCVSSVYWIDSEIEQYSGAFGIPPKINLSDDIEGVLVPQLSYVDITIGNVNILTTLYHLENLTAKSSKSKEYWMRLGIIDENWNYLV